MQTGDTDIITSWKLEALPDEILYPVVFVLQN